MLKGKLCRTQNICKTREERGPFLKFFLTVLNIYKNIMDLDFKYDIIDTYD